MSSHVRKENKPDLPELSSQGHFLKGSSVTLGLTRLRDYCERIQNYGSGKDDKGDAVDLDPKTLVKMIEDTLKEAKHEYSFIEAKLRKYYEQSHPQENDGD